MTTVIIGAGVIGTTLAHELAADGDAVTVVDRAEGAADETSFANGSLITPSMSDPWAAPGTPAMALKYFGREDAPFLVRLAALPAMAGWGLSFLGNCTERRWRENTAAVFPLAQYSRDRLDALTSRLAIDYDRYGGGTLRIHADARSMDAAEVALSVYRDLGCDIRKLDRAACLAMEPALGPVADQVHGGFHFPGDRSGDCRMFTRAMARRCADAGVQFRFGTTVVGFSASGGRIDAVETSAERLAADRFVIAAGSESALLGRGLGLGLPVFPVKGYSATFDVGGWNQAPHMPIVDSGRKIAVVRMGNRIRVAGTAEFAGFDPSYNAIRSGVLMRLFGGLFPDSAGIGLPAFWHGLRPMSPDGRPRIGRTRYANLFVSTGHGALGWTLSAGSARALADLMGGRRPAVDLSAFAGGVA